MQASFVMLCGSAGYLRPLPPHISPVKLPAVIAVLDAASRLLSTFGRQPPAEIAHVVDAHRAGTAGRVHVAAEP
jgi:hypothetical protein